MFSSFYLLCRGKDTEEMERLNRSETSTFLNEYIITSIRRVSFYDLDFQSKIKETNKNNKKNVLYSSNTVNGQKM